MDRTFTAVDLAATASATRPCALVGAVAAPGAPSAVRAISINKKRNGSMASLTGVTTRRQRSFTT